MRNQLHPLDRDRLAAFLAGPLLREARLGSARLTALAEAEGAALCALDDNARAAELLALPELHDAAPHLAEGVLDAALAMADAPLPCTRLGTLGLLVLRDDPGDFEVLTPFHRFTGDLGAGVVRQALRLPGATPVMHSGNVVHFNLGLRRSSADVEETVTHAEIRREPGRVVLVHESEVTGLAGLFRPRRVTAGRLRYEYEIQEASPVLRLRVTFTAARRVFRLRLTTAADALSEPGLGFATGRLLREGAWHEAEATTGAQHWAKGPVAHLSLLGAAPPVLHLRPAEPARVVEVLATSHRTGAVHWLMLRHRGGSVRRGRTVRLEETRLLARAVGAEAAAARMPHAAELPGSDLEPASPSGLLLLALASHLLMARSGAWRETPAPERLARLEAAFHRHLALLLAADRPRVADLAHGTVAAATLWHATAEAGLEEAGAALLSRLLGRQREGVFEEADGEATLEGQAAGLLALARAAALAPARALPALAEALEALQPVRAPGRDAPEGFTLPGGRGAGRGGLELGLLARALRAVQEGAEAGQLPAELAGPARERHRLAVALLRPLVRARGAMLEVLASPRGEPGGAAAQVAMMLALMGADAVALRRLHALPSAA